MALEYVIESIVSARNVIRNKMVAAGQATRTDKLEALAANLSIGTDTSDATVTSSDQIISGYSAYSKGTKYEGTGTAGIDTSDATASASDILSTKTAYVDGEKVTGSMTNRGAVSQTLNPGGSYTVPQGYHNGSGSVSARSLNMQSKSGTISPSADWSSSTTNSVTITPDSGYDGMSSVSVSTPMLRDNTLMTVSTVSAPSTVYNGDTAQSNSEKMLRVAPTKDGMGYTGSYLYVPKSGYMGDATAADVASGKTFSSASGIQLTGTASMGTDTSDATASASDILVGKTAYVKGVKITGTLGSSFSDATDEEITAALAAHRLGLIDLRDYWSVGDERPVHLSAMSATGVGESHVAQDQTLVILHGSNCFDLSDGGKNVFVIGLKNLLANGVSGEYGYINSTSTNVGGWESLARRTWCDNIFMKALPTEVQKWFRKFKYKTSDGNGLTTSTEMENYFTFASVSNVFGPSYDTNYAPTSEDESQFDYYKTSSNRIKKNGDSGGTRGIWWLRSPLVSGPYRFCLIYNNGMLSNGDPKDNYGFAPFGCV